MNNEKRNIILTGMPGSGKTTIGKKLADKIGYNFCDFDDDILEKITIGTATQIYDVLNLQESKIEPEQLINREVKELLKLLGENNFLKLEGFMGEMLVFDEPTVLSASGSLPLKLSAMEKLKSDGTIIYIDIPINLIINRLKEMKTDRIIGMGKMTMEEMLKSRKKYYDVTKDFNFKIPVFEHNEDKTKIIREKEKKIIFDKFMEFYDENIK